MTVDIDQVEGLDDSVAVLPAGLVEAVADQVQCCITVRSRMGVIAFGSPLCSSLTVMSRFLRSGPASRGDLEPEPGAPGAVAGPGGRGFTLPTWG